MTREDACEKARVKWLPILEKSFGCAARIDEAATEEFEWGWVFRVVPVDPEACEDERERAAIAADRENGNTVPVGTRGVSDAMRYLMKHRKVPPQGGGEVRAAPQVAAPPAGQAGAAKLAADPDMTEAEWATCEDPKRMLYRLMDWEKASERKLRLFSAACCRRIWGRIADERCRRAVEVAERLADGNATAEECRSALREAKRASKEADREADARRRQRGQYDYADEAACSALSSAIYCLGPRRDLIACNPAHNAVRFRVAAEAGLKSGEGWHSAAYVTAGRQADQAHVGLLHDIFDSLFRPVALGPSCFAPGVVSLAERIYDGREFGRMPELADALEAAGCAAPEVLAHCRGPGPHARGCWVLDLLLGRV